jgi:hypothetical protein
MPAEKNANMTQPIICQSDRLFLEPRHFVPVAIPENVDQSRILKADLEANDIPVQLEIREAEMDTKFLGGVPVLVPEQAFEYASEIVSIRELDAIDDEDEVADEDFEDDDDDDDDDFDEEWDGGDDEDFEDDDDDELDFEADFSSDNDFDDFN